METTRLRLLYEAAHEGSVTTLLELLQQDRLILDRLIVDGNFPETPLHVAAMLGHADFVKEILRRKPQLAKELDSQRSSPLHLAAAKGHLETVKALLAVSSEMCFARDRHGRNPVYLAAVKGRLDVLGELVRVPPNAARVISGRGETVLHACVRHNQLEALRLFVEVMQDDYQLLNARDDYGMTILHLAVADKQFETVKFLLTNTRIEVNATNANGFTALDILAQSQRNEKDFDIAELLRAAGALRTIDHMPRLVPFVAEHDQPLNMPQSMSLEKLRRDHNEPQDWLTRKRETLMVVASLIATMAFQAGINPPGGLWQDDSSNTGSAPSSGSQPGQDHEAGTSIMAYKEDRYYAPYLYYNTIGFVASLSIILLLVTGLPFARRFFMWLLTVIMWIAITCMALTYRISIDIFTPSKEDQVAHSVISYLVYGWCGFMALVFLSHTIRLTAKLFRKFENLVRPRRKPIFITTS